MILENYRQNTDYKPQTIKETTKKIIIPIKGKENFYRLEELLK